MKELKLNLLEDVLEGIWKGELKHVQEDYICDSAMCVCGWLMVNNLNKVIDLELPKDNFNSPNQIVLHNELNIEGKCYEDIAAYIVGLTRAEGILLFDMNATKQLHLYVLNALKQGKRLQYDYPYISHTDFDIYNLTEKDHYNTGQIDIVILNNMFKGKLKLAIEEFLDIPETEEKIKIYGDEYF